LSRGDAVGRYVVLDPLGSGGMGVVYTAYDPELDRKVALKLVRPRHEERLPEAEHAQGQARLVREAQALARLSHPHVVTVHDVGTHQGDVFIAMELVEGVTLARWLAAGPRPWREVIEILESAGRGLEAAHRAGLVHRDFKPDNVIVRPDGQAVVTDFGLARAEQVDTPEAPAAPDLSLTDPGTLLGTPAYMAPEQHRGRAADARSDQFAFCVVLYQALYRERPFRAIAGDGLSAGAALAVEVVSGRVQPPPAGARVPAWLRRVVLRGLAPDPARRWPSMTELLAALRRDPGRAARRWLLAGAAAAVLAAGGVAWASGAARRGALCARAGERVASVWDAPHREAVRAAFAATGAAYAEDTFQRAAAALDAYAAGWSRARAETCAATELRHEQSAELMDLRMACLDRRLGAFTALVTLFGAGPDKEVLDHAVRAALTLEPLDACADPVALRAAVAPTGTTVPAGVASRVASLRARLDPVRARYAAGKYREAAAAVNELLPDIRATGYPPLLAEALTLRAQLEVWRDVSRSEADLREVLAAAAAAKDDLRMARALAGLIAAIGGPGGDRTAEALALVPVAEAIAQRAGADPGTLSNLRRATAQVLLKVARYPEAEKAAREALELRERAYGPESPEVAAVLGTVAIVEMEAGKYAEARAADEHALAIIRGKLGPDQPEALPMLNALAGMARYRSDYDGAAAYLQQALTLAERSLGPTSAAVGTISGNLAVVLGAQRRYDEAHAAFRRALEIKEKLLGPEHSEVGMLHAFFGGALMEEHRLDEAQAELERGLAIVEKALGRDAPFLSAPLNNLAQLYLERKRPTAALPLAQRALEVTRKAFPEDHPEIAESRLVLADCLDRLGRPAEAIPLVEAGARVLDARQPGNRRRGEARLIWAEALWRTAERRRAVPMAEEARRIAGSLGDDDGARAAADWLAAHRR
jgi:eukaryotic-like serine/threonine-protein kinase